MQSLVSNIKPLRTVRLKKQINLNNSLSIAGSEIMSPRKIKVLGKSYDKKEYMKKYGLKKMKDT